MKKGISFFIILSFFFLPQITFAAWWNPMSWFEKAELSQTMPTHAIEAATSNSDAVRENTLDGQENKSQSSWQSVQAYIDEIAVLKAMIADLRREIASLRNNPIIKEVAKEVPVEVEKIVYKDRIVERPVEKIVYRDRIIERPVYQPSVNTNYGASAATPPPDTNPYSDYDFDYKWTYKPPPLGGLGERRLTCPMTPRSIAIKKAVFEVPEAGLQTINEFRRFEADGIQVTITIPGIIGEHGSRYVTEKSGSDRYVFFGGAIPVCTNGDEIIVRDIQVNAAKDISGQGRNVNIYLEQRGIDVHNNYPISIPVTPVMSEWEIWDKTTDKPVKIN